MTEYVQKKHMEDILKNYLTQIKFFMLFVSWWAYTAFIIHHFVVHEDKVLAELSRQWWLFGTFLIVSVVVIHFSNTKIRYVCPCMAAFALNCIVELNCTYESYALNEYIMPAFGFSFMVTTLIPTQWKMNSIIFKLNQKVLII